MICGHCGKAFEAKRISGKWCSQACSAQAFKKRQPPKTVRHLQCRQCGKDFETTDKRKAFCSISCNTTFQNKQRPNQKAEARECPLCGTMFKPMQARGVGKRYCSKLCQGRAKHLRYRAHAGKVKYNLTEDGYQALLAEQNGVCAICSQPETAKNRHSERPKKLAVDHCHDTGKIRGLLCTRCNQGLGYFKDDPIRITTAIAYLKKFT